MSYSPLAVSLDYKGDFICLILVWLIWCAFLVNGFLYIFPILYLHMYLVNLLFTMKYLPFSFFVHILSLTVFDVNISPFLKF